MSNKITDGQVANIAKIGEGAGLDNGGVENLIDAIANGKSSDFAKLSGRATKDQLTAVIAAMTQPSSTSSISSGAWYARITAAFIAQLLSRFPKRSFHHLNPGPCHETRRRIIASRSR